MSQSDSIESSRPVLALASSNPGKIAEFQAIFGEHVDVRPLSAFNAESPEETGSTFEDNAELKARFLHNICGAVVLADDSGLEVDALGGEPGVRSARFAGDEHDDAANRRLLLERMKELPAVDRAARFVAVIAVIDAAGTLTLARGTCEGLIGLEERGEHGFGYDPLFVLPEGHTMAELPVAEKNRISHRARAIEQALPTLRAALGLSDATAVHSP